MKKYVATITYCKSGASYDIVIIKDSIEETQDAIESIRQELKNHSFIFLSSVIETLDSHFSKDGEGDEIYH
jgi:hypothetical protein